MKDTRPSKAWLVHLVGSHGPATMKQFRFLRHSRCMSSLNFLPINLIRPLIDWKTTPSRPESQMYPYQNSPPTSIRAWRTSLAGVPVVESIQETIRSI